MVRKTFFFSALLVILVIIISFAILYFTMPGYYLFKKEQALTANLDALITDLRAAETQVACKELISSFVEANNVTVISYTAAGLAAELSSPLVTMQSGGEANTFWFSYGNTGSGLAYGDMPLISIALRENNTGPMHTGARHEIMQRAVIRSNHDSGDLITLNRAIETALMDQITVIGTLQPIDEAKGVIFSLMPYALLMGLTLGLFFSWVYARQISKPILQISAATEHMQLLEPAVVSGIRSQDELGLLSSNLDALYVSLCDNIAQLHKEMDKVNRLERTKTEMMQSASHELKTPIAALSGMLEGMIDNIGVYQDKEKYLLECKGQVEKLSLLVGEILRSSQAESAESVEFIETQLADLVNQALTDHIFAADEKGLHLVTELVPVTIITDPDSLYRVLTNLIGNAVRHTPSGGEIRIDLQPEEFYVENTCAPIYDEELPKLFEPFYTRSYSRNKLESGTGLGLYIVKRNLEMLQIPYIAESTEFGLRITLKLM